MKRLFHRRFAADVDRIEAHVFEVSGDLDAARRRVVEIDDMISRIAENPHSGVRLSGRLSGLFARHGGRGARIIIVFKPEPERGAVRFVLAAFGGEDWPRRAAGRD